MKLVNQSTLTSQITLPGGGTEQVTTKSNESSTEQMSESFSKIKAANKTYAKPNDEIEYTITLTNDSDYTISDLTLKDTLSTDAQFVAGSVTIDGTAYATYDPTAGFTLADLVASGSTTIKYKAQVVATPASENITNIAAVTYTVNEVTGLSENTNEVSVPVLNNVITLTKTSDKSAVISGQTLTYQIVVANTGNADNSDLLFTDPLPSGVTFVADSVKFDGVQKPGLDPTTGFEMDDLAAGNSVTVTFDVTID